MQSVFSNALSRAVSNHIGLSPTRQETLAWLVLLMLQHGTICLWRLAAHVNSPASVDSVRRRFYRFFQYVALDGTAAARVVVAMLGLHGKPWVLAMDRTNWEFGRTSINILMVSVIWNGVGIPLIWRLLPSSGCSSTQARTDLLDQLQATFPDLQVARLLGDREFIGDAWMAYLVRQKIPFVLRLRENQYVRRHGYAPMAIAGIARPLRPGEKTALKGWCRLGAADEAPLVRIVVLRLATGEVLALACSGRPKPALAAYRQRWTIESLFGTLKTRGFSMEATHLKDHRKLSTLLAVMALAVALAVKTGRAATRLSPIPIKAHGRRACSVFALGLTRLRRLFAKHGREQVFPLIDSLLSSAMPPNVLMRLTN